MTFKDLKVGDVFKFTSAYDRWFSGDKRAWVKISARKYRALYQDDFIAQVGTIHVRVTTEKSIVYRN